MWTKTQDWDCKIRQWIKSLQKIEQNLSQKSENRSILWRFDQWANWIFQIFFFCCLSCGVNIKMSLAAAASFTWWFTGLDCEGLKECLYLLKILEFFHCLFIWLFIEIMLGSCFIWCFIDPLFKSLLVFERCSLVWTI